MIPPLSSFYILPTLERENQTKMKSLKLTDFMHTLHHLLPTCMHGDDTHPKITASLLKPDHRRHDPKKTAFFVGRLHDLLLAFNMHEAENQTTKKKKVSEELSLKFIIEKIHEILYGNTETLPNEKWRTELTVEMFKESPNAVNHPFRLLITCFPKMDLESKKCVTEIVASLLAQTVSSHAIACEYLEENLDIIDALIAGSFDFDEPSVALLYGFMVRESIRRSQIVTRHVLEYSDQKNVRKFLEGAQHPDYTVASYVTTTFELLLTRQRSTVSDFLTRNSEWFFDDFGSKLLESKNTLTRFHALKILRDVLSSLGEDHVAMVRFLSSEQMMRTVMNLLREIGKSSQLTKQKSYKSSQARRNAFKIFKLFVDNRNKTEKIVKILVMNKEKICKFLLEELKIDNEDEQFEEDKAQVIREIEAL